MFNSVYCLSGRVTFLYLDLSFRIVSSLQAIYGYLKYVWGGAEGNFDIVFFHVNTHDYDVW